MGCIPIVLQNDIYVILLDLFILQVESYNQLTNDTLVNFLKKDFNSEMIEMEYWTKKIKQSL